MATGGLVGLHIGADLFHPIANGAVIPPAQLIADAGQGKPIFFAQEIHSNLASKGHLFGASPAQQFGHTQIEMGCHQLDNTACLPGPSLGHQIVENLLSDLAVQGVVIER